PPMNLPPASAEVVKGRARIVAESADDATVLFYRDRFAAHPKPLNVFNEPSKAIGEQPKALPASGGACAVHLIDPAATGFDPVMRRSAHKHVSLGISAPEYMIVGHYLLGAAAKILGDAATREIAAAWDEVYWLFATALIAEDARLYAEAGTDPDEP